MSLRPIAFLSNLRRNLRSFLLSPPALAFFPAFVLAAFWLGGEKALLAAALLFPVLFAVTGGFSADEDIAIGTSGTTMTSRKGFLTFSDMASRCSGNGQNSVCIMARLDEYDEIQDRYGASSAETLVRHVGDRMACAMRSGDIVFHMSQDRIAVVAAPMARLSLEDALQIVTRLQITVEEPLSLDATTVFLSCSFGFCLASRNPGSTAESWLDAALAASDEAARHGPSCIRAFSPGMVSGGACGDHTHSTVTDALESGQIRAWFQPQISTDTGQVTGFEALARWHHPQKGILSPAQFLPIIEEAGMLPRLGEIMLFQALTALKVWDSEGLEVPAVGVNFSTEELRDPKLVEKIRWELDRFDLAADKLTVEVLETVVSSGPDDTICRNILGLSRLGCGIDLDDFGTGHASILSLRRFDIKRIKIDRTFVKGVDHEPEQQKMVAGILSMAERLGLDTIAEGVESVGEHAILSQLGCGHVQGFGIARPMPFEETGQWIVKHNAKLLDPPSIRRKSP